MKQLMSITITLLFVFTLVFATQVAETQARSHMGGDHMNDYPGNDDDGIPDDVDNCPAMPNGPDGGTCSAGKVGDPCMKHGDCGCAGECSKDQEDTDEDGLGDVCDNCPNNCNYDQWDGDVDGIGDVCDPTPTP
jgi:hypothetical protein